MPKFPSYHGPPLPQVLNPLDPRHYWMLADWIFFKPSRLKQYLHQDDPDLYFEKGWQALRSAVRRPAVRNLLLMSLVLTLVLSVAVAWAAEAAQATQMEWGGWAFGVAGGVAFGVALGVAFGVAGGVAFGVAFGVVGGVVVSVATCVIASVMLGIVLGTGSVLAFGVAAGVCASLMLGVAVDAGYGVIIVVLIMLLFFAMWVLALEVAWLRTPNGPILEIARILVKAGLLYGIPFGLGIVLGVLRSVFYVFQIPSALWQILRPGPPASRLDRHPVLKDELVALPFPGLSGLLMVTLTKDFESGTFVAYFLLRNSLQRWVVSRSFSAYSMAVADPLRGIYSFLACPLADEYAYEPTVEWEMKHSLSIEALFLGEIADVFVDPSGEHNPNRLLFEQWIWTITKPLRGKPNLNIAPLANFLLSLLRLEKLAAEGPDLELVEKASKAVRPLPHAEEVSLSLAALCEWVMVETLDDLTRIRRGLGWLDHLPEPPLRPQVLEAMRGLVDVSTEVTRFQQATSPVTQAAALNRAVGMLEELEAFVEQINLPEQTLLTLTIDRWQSLVAEAAGWLGERALRELSPAQRRALAGGERRATLWARPAEHFPNPYKSGDPVLPPLFAGREDVFRHILEVWRTKTNPDSVILYGHRRMGKSSILRNLGAYAPEGSLLVYADLKGETAFGQGTQTLLRGLADALAWSARDQGLEIPEPDAADYADPAAAGQAFRRLLRRVRAALPEEASVILALDEFEAIDQAVADGRIGPGIYNYLRSLSQAPRVVLVFAGLHTLDEMSRDYRAAFFGSYVNLRVSYLDTAAAERLIKRPTPDFPLNYHLDVVARIIEETHGQALLVQRICQELVHHVNHQLFDLEREREARVLPADLDAVLSDAFVRSETRYFDGIWTDQIAGRPAVEAVLRALAPGPATVAEIGTMAELSPAELDAALDYLETRDLVRSDAAGRWDLRVPLMRRWLRLRERNTHQ